MYSCLPPLLQIALRRMVFLVLKELAKVSEDVIIAIAILVKDITNSQIDIYRANAIRVISRIIDVRHLLLGFIL